MYPVNQAEDHSGPQGDGVELFGSTERLDGVEVVMRMSPIDPWRKLDFDQLGGEDEEDVGKIESGLYGSESDKSNEAGRGNGAPGRFENFGELISTRDEHPHRETCMVDNER